MRFAPYLASVAALTACTTAPEDRNKTLVGPQFYELVLDMEIQGQRFSTTTRWHCFQEWTFDENFIWRIHTGVSKGSVVKTVGAYSAVIFGLPGIRANCETPSIDSFQPSVAFIRNTADLSSVEVYPGSSAANYLAHLGQVAPSDVIKRIQFRVITGADGDTKATAAEEKLREHFRANWFRYQSKVAIFVPESAWKHRPEVLKQFSTSSGLLRAPENPRTKRRGAYEPRMFEWRVPLGPELKDIAVARNMFNERDVWYLGGVIGPAPLVLRCCAEQIKPESYYTTSRVQYKDTLLPDIRIIQEVYDPQDRVLVKFYDVSLGPVF